MRLGHWQCIIAGRARSDRPSKSLGRNKKREEEGKENASVISICEEGELKLEAKESLALDWTGLCSTRLDSLAT